MKKTLDMNDNELYHHIHSNGLSKSVTCDGCAEMFDEREIDFTHPDYFRCEDCAEKHSDESYKLYWGKERKNNG